MSSTYGELFDLLGDELLRNTIFLQLNFHTLRHSYAAYMVSKNVNFKIIQEQLGHSDIKMTINIYSHLTSIDKNKASDFFDDLI